MTIAGRVLRCEVCLHCQEMPMDPEDPEEVILEAKPAPVVWYPYNESFKFYGEPRAGKRAQQFIDAKNQLKGGHWVLHTKAQYAEWYAREGRAKEDIRFMNRTRR